MIWIILGVIVILIITFATSYQKDNRDLKERDLHKKFNVLISRINEFAFDNRGEITTIDKRHCNLYREGSNQIISFMYGNGSLFIIWKCKYFQKEVVHKKNFSNCRNLSLFEQRRIADVTIDEMEQIVANHKKEVLPTGMVRTVENHRMGDNAPSTAKQEDIEEISDIITKFSRDPNVYTALKNNSNSAIALTKANYFTKLLSFYVKENTGSELEIGIRNLRFKTCSFKYSCKVMELSKINGHLLLFSNFLRNTEAIDVTNHIILSLENNEITRWMFVEETPVAQLVYLYMLNEDGEMVNCRKLPDAQINTIYAELARRLDKTPTQVDWEDLLDDFYNKI